MITRNSEFEDALERAALFLESPPAEGSAEYKAFDELLAEIAAYAPEMPMESEPTAMDDLVARASALQARASELVRKRQERARAASLSSFPEDVEGIGPTTGV